MKEIRRQKIRKETAQKKERKEEASPLGPIRGPNRPSQPRKETESVPLFLSPSR
jgi:hypothetical protein